MLFYIKIKMLKSLKKNLLSSTIISQFVPAKKYQYHQFKKLKSET